MVALLKYYHAQLGKKLKDIPKWRSCIRSRKRKSKKVCFFNIIYHQSSMKSYIITSFA